MSQVQIAASDDAGAFATFSFKPSYRSPLKYRLHLTEVVMDLFLVGTLLFLLANVAVVVSMLRRVNVNNDSVLAWEQSQIATSVQPVSVQPATVVYQAPLLAEAA
jgi:hypothetical protein